MSSKAYIEASRLETENCRKAIENLYMKEINHDGHSWNTFGDIEDCLAVVIEEVYRKGMADAIDECIKALKGYGMCDLADKITLLEQLKGGQKNE